MDPERQRTIASKGGKTAHARGTAHTFTPEKARRAGQKGGRTTAATHGRAFYEKIGRRGGQAASRDAGRMAEIGRKGGRSRKKRKS